MAGRLTQAGIARTAQGLGVEVAAIRAVIDVESNGAGFLPDGRPRILFEAHIFARLTGGIFTADHPTLSSTHWNRKLYGSAAEEYQRLYAALQLDADAAQQSCSWGLFQVMGFNWQSCGERSLAGFVLAMHHHEDAHLALFARFVAEHGLTSALRQHDWATFARGYNGPAYAENAYDTKLAAAYARHAPGGD